MSNLSQYIKDVPDFPKKGILFKDLAPIFKDHFDELVTEFIDSFEDWEEVDYIAGIESRGFIIGAAIAAELGIGFIPIRKAGKLPPPVISQSYSLEYGEDKLEIAENINKANIVLIDDVLATGGTLNAARLLCEKTNYHVLAEIVYLNIKALNSRNTISLLDV